MIPLDLRMPVMDGWVFRREQQRDPVLGRIPVILLSGTDVDRFPQLNAAEAFEKPVSLSQIVSTVRRLSAME